MRTRKPYSSNKNKTLKIRCNGHIDGINQDGWKIVHIYGEPFERGFAHGYLLFRELLRVKTVFSFLLENELNVSYNDYMRVSNKIIKPIIKNKFPEFYNELKGISSGANKAGSSISIDFLIAWNSYMSIYSHFKDGGHLRCTAFIATGNATKNGDIVMAHNTHCDFTSGQLFNIVLYVFPTSGNSFVMQTTPGYIASGTDWFLSSTGIIGCETTISNINYKPDFGVPYFCRIRQAMQYGKTIDEYVDIMSTDNAGDYACSWLLGDINTNEIMLFELGLKEKNIKKTKNGVFYGMNSAIGCKLRETETDDIDHTNIATSVGSRNERLKYLLNDKYKGKLDINNAKSIIADHYDSQLKTETPGIRSICKHCELSEEHSSNRQSYYLFGCTDAKVVDSDMARKLSFDARFGSACGREFSIKKHIIENPKYKKWAKVLDDFIPYNWTKIVL